MSSPLSLVLAVAGIFVVGSWTASAQIGVYDPAVTTRNTVTAIVKQSLLRTQQEQHSQLRRMAQRLSMFTNLAKYSLPDAPRWRIHDFENPELLAVSRALHAALNYGDAAGAAYLAASHPVQTDAQLLSRLGAAARRLALSRLATLEAADAAAIAAIHESGRLRLNGRRELAAIEVLDAHVVDPTLEQSATAVLDKISGAALIGARQRQARIQLLAATVEQLLTDSKRARDTDAIALNMQLTAWRDGTAANEAFVRGSADALRTWRQP
jgi:hypothetical protein